MAQEARGPATGSLDIDLRNPAWAAFWAWFWPGAGHFYQRRHAKGVLFMVCILSTYFFGLTLGSGHVVYASWAKNDRRWQYFCQLGVGAVALPALWQARQARAGEPTLCGGLMAPPRNVAESESRFDLERDELARWHLELNSRFELGTLFTMIAGLLNVLAIYDAYAGPVLAVPEKSDKPTPDVPRKPKPA